MECFAFGGGTVRFASLETSFHAANHTIPPPPSYEGYPLCPKDKNRSPFHGEKPLIVKWFLKKRLYQSQKWFCMVGTRYFASTPNGWYSTEYYGYERTWSITLYYPDFGWPFWVLSLMGVDSVKLIPDRGWLGGFANLGKGRLEAVGRKATLPKRQS